MTDYVIGNEYTQYYGTTYNMNDADKMTAYIFKAQVSKTVTEVRVRTGADTGTSPYYRVGLQAIDGAYEPTGTWLGASNLGYEDIQFLTTGWKTATLTDTVALTAGTWYAVVIQYASGTIDGSNYGKPYHSVMYAYPPGQPKNIADTDTNYVDANFRRKYSTNGGTSWYTSGCPCYMLVFSDASKQGQPYSSGFSIDVYGDNWEREEFVVDGTQTVRAIELWTKRSGTPLGDLEYEIRGPDSESVLRSGFIAPAGTSVSTSFHWERATLATPLTMNDGSTYRIVWKSPNSTTSSNCFEVTYCGLDSAYQLDSWGLTVGHGEYSTNGGSGWNTRTWDTLFRLDTAGTFDKTFTADAILKASGLTKTFTADAWIGAAQYEKTFTADAILKATFTKTFDADALLKQTGLTKTFAIDAMILGGPTIVSPDGGSSESSPVYLVFTTSDLGTGLKRHFLLELDKTSSAFGDLEIDLDSYQSQTNWQFWDGDSWEALPAAGLDPAYYGNNVRYQATLTDGNKWWRVREKMRRDS